MADNDREPLEPMEKNYTPRHDKDLGNYEPRTPGVTTGEQLPPPPPSKDD
jgi:hypothetical protein